MTDTASAVCWYCDKNPASADSQELVTMSCDDETAAAGDASEPRGQVRDVVIPRCPTCAEADKIAERNSAQGCRMFLAAWGAVTLGCMYLLRVFDKPAEYLLKNLSTLAAMAIGIAAINLVIVGPIALFIMGPVTRYIASKRAPERAVKVTEPRLHDRDEYPEVADLLEKGWVFGRPEEAS